MSFEAEGFVEDFADEVGGWFVFGKVEKTGDYFGMFLGDVVVFA